MEGTEQIILTISGLVLVALVAATAGARLGAPLLLVFLAVGVLAGPEGPGHILLDNPDAAYAAASAALAVILVDGGLRTRPEALRLGWRPGLALAILGTAVTAGITALAAYSAFGLGWRESLLVGAVVSSTDAAAVFALIGGSGVRVREKLLATLEVESGVNDPVAVFMTVTIARLLVEPASGGLFHLATELVWEAMGGMVVGVIAGRTLATVTPRIRLAAGLRPILILAVGLFAFATAQAMGASGFLAAYVCGVAHARRDHQGVVEAEARALDGFAWLAQLALFLTLGLLATPSHIAFVAGPALAVALALMLVARPIATFLSLAPFNFPWNEKLFAAWAGLRGATPIFLGLIPAALDAPNANLYFSVAFVVVGVSLVAQGWTTGFAARRLGLGGEGAGVEVKFDALKGGAVAAAVAASVVAVTVLARVAAPSPVVTITPASVQDLEAAVGSRNGGALVTALPPDWDTLDDPAKRRELFAAVVGPLVAAENARIRAERADVSELVEADELGEPLSLSAQARRDLLSRAYGVDYGDLAELHERVDIVPVRLAVAQAAFVTGWGSTDAAQQANSLFGRRPRPSAPGAAPPADGEPQGGKPGTGAAAPPASGAASAAAAPAPAPRKFASLSESVADYIDALNTHPAFEAFRAARAKARAEGREPTAEELAPFVAPFAADGPAFAAAVAKTMESLPEEKAEEKEKAPRAAATGPASGPAPAPGAVSP